MTRIGSVTLLILSVATTGCWFVEQGPGIEADRPPRVGPPLEPSRGPMRGAGVSQTPGRSRTSIPQAGELPPVSLPKQTTEIRKLPEGMILALDRVKHPLPQRFVDHVTLTIPHAEETSGDRHAVAALTARVIADSPRPDPGLPSLRESIENRGGTLEISTDGAATRFQFSVISPELNVSLEDLFDAIRRTPTAPQIESVQQSFLTEVSEYLAGDPVGGVLQRVASAAPSSRHPLDALQDVSRTQVVLFHRRAYRPAGAILTIGSQLGQKRLEMAEQAARPWLAGHDAAVAEPVPGLSTPAGVLWAKGPDEVIASLLFDLPPTTGAASAPQLIALECLLDLRPKGRFDRLVASKLDNDPEFEIRRFDNGPGEVLTISFPCPADQVDSIRIAATELLTDLTNKPPTKSEISNAAARMRLLLMRERANPALAVTATARALMADPDLSPTAFDDLLGALERPTDLDLEPAIALISSGLPRVVVAGGAPPHELSNVVALPEMRSAIDLAIPRADIQAQTIAATVYLELALTALGGREQIADFTGCYGKLLIRTGRGPDAIDEIAWDVKNKRFRRIRRVLASTIDTIISDSVGRDYFGMESVKLAEDETRTIIAQIERHPLFLLAAYARGESMFRLISTRRRGDRPFAILELIDPSRPRLRMYVDAESGLVRVIDTIEHHAGIGTTTVTEHFRDYRSTLTKGLRTPFRVTTVIDDGAAGRIGTWLEFVPTQPPPQSFERAPR